MWIIKYVVRNMITGKTKSMRSYGSTRQQAFRHALHMDSKKYRIVKLVGSGFTPYKV